MPSSDKSVIMLLDFIKIDKFYVTCHFKCKVKNRTIVSTVPFEPFDGKIEFTWKEVLLHPLDSYNRYYHTPITIYDSESRNTIVLKAFKNVSSYFVWDDKEKKYIFDNKENI